MTGIESTQVGAESLRFVGDVAANVTVDIYALMEAHARGTANPDESELVLSDALADVNQLRALIAGLRDDAHQRAVEAAGGGK